VVATLANKELEELQPKGLVLGQKLKKGCKKKFRKLKTTIEEQLLECPIVKLKL
jgi:hypothetical protein